MGRRPTIVDVARAAGVSKSTVSLVLQESPLVRPATREAVAAAMAALGYVYNRAAANLRGAGAGLVGLVINDLRNPFFAEFAASAQMAFAEHGYATVVANTDERPALQTQVLGSMVEHGVSAVVISPAYAEGALDGLLRAGTPTLQVLRRVDPRGGRFPFMAPDYAAGGRIAARRLRERGARRIAFVGGMPDRPVTAERMAGYAAVMAEDGLAALHLPGRPSRAFGREAALRLARERSADAALCFSDLVALGMLSGFAEAGVRLGEDFLLVGFDDIEECALVWPPLSSVRCDVAGLGRRAAAAMLGWLAGGPPPPPEERTAVSLVERRSSLGPR